jgi:hypothetical protein
MRNFKINSICLFLLFFGFVENSFSQRKEKINLATAFDNNELSLVNRTAHTFKEGTKQGIVLSENKGEGLVWLNNKTFSEGVVEIDLKGQDVFQKSFLGIAFHSQNDTVYEAVYFRPFNFHATDSVRKIHAVQYVSHPKDTWKKLREEKNGQFEKGIVNAPNPNEWFHVRIEITASTVSVFVNDNPIPDLSVPRLSSYTDEKIGLFAGDDSSGSFANLVIKRKK